MFRKKAVLFVTLLSLVAVFCFVSCDPNPDSGSGTSEPVPDNVLEYGAGVFELVEDVVTRCSDYTSYDFSDGRSFSWTSSTTIVLTVDNYIAESSIPPDPDLILDGNITLTLLSDNPYQIQLVGSLTTSGLSSDSASINGTAYWATGENPEDDMPSSVNGTFTVNGTGYDMATIYAQIKSSL